jgi:hypothetical protein
MEIDGAGDSRFIGSTEIGAIECVEMIDFELLNRA